MYLLDTNVISELRKPPSRVDRGVVEWVAKQEQLFLHISAVTVFELDLGVRRVERRDGAQGEGLRRWLDEVLALFQGRILPFDAAVAQRAAALQVPDPRPRQDCFIAATGLVHGLTVVTRNSKDFSPMAVPVLNPWGASDT